MTQSPRGSHVTTARGCLPRLVSRLRGETGGEIGGWETAELAAVYDTLAMLVAEALDVDTTEASGALAVFRGDQDARGLARGQPARASRQLQLFRSRVVSVTVTYECEAGGRSRRVTELAYTNPAGDLWSARAATEFGYEDLPGRVRERMLAGGQRAVRYQLYPAPPVQRPGTAPTATGHPFHAAAAAFPGIDERK